MSPTSFFISYSHADKALAVALEDALISLGCAVWRDENELLPGDSLTERISQAVFEVEYMAVLVSDDSTSSDWCRKELSLALSRGLNEGRVRVMPLRVAEAAMPPSLSDVIWTPIDDATVERAASRLVTAAAEYERRAGDEGAGTAGTSSAPLSPPMAAKPLADAFEPIRIVGIVEDAVGRPRNDGTRGSGLYAVPLALSATPSPLWAEALRRTWDNPPTSSMMHRPGIASVIGDRIILDGTTIDEVERHHAATLRTVIPRVNHLIEEATTRQRERDEREDAQQRAREDAVRDAARRISFE